MVLSRPKARSCWPTIWPSCQHSNRSAYALISTGRPTARASTEYRFFSNRTRQVLDTDAGTAWNPSKGPT